MRVVVGGKMVACEPAESAGLCDRPGCLSFSLKWASISLRSTIFQCIYVHIFQKYSLSCV